MGLVIAHALVRVRETVAPDDALRALYDARYTQFSAVYPAVRDLYKKLK